MINQQIRNFCIIAHIDHGKSTLADRFLELTNTINPRKMSGQYLDMMDLEKERGITIKMQPVRMEYKSQISPVSPSASRGGNLKSQNYILNLIDTPGHIDFSYEVSRALKAVEGAILLIDGTKGVQAQTLHNFYLAKEEGLTIIPVINKIDVASCDIERTCRQLEEMLKIDKKEIYFVSAKTGEGVEELVKVIIEKIPPPRINDEKILRGLIFDSVYNRHKGVIIHCKIVDGSVSRGDRMMLVKSQSCDKVIEVGVFTPEMKATESLSSGEIGYIVTGLKSVGEARVGDTITTDRGNSESDVVQPVEGYKEIQPMVYSNIFISSAESSPLSKNKKNSDFDNLKNGLYRLALNDSSLSITPYQSPLFGLGFRCGFNGVLHLEIIKERLSREFGVDVIVTPPSVVYKTIMSGKNVDLYHPSELPSGKFPILEPWAKLEILIPMQYYGSLIQLLQEKRGIPDDIESLKIINDLVLVKYDLPLIEVISDLNDKLKNISSGYGSLSYQFENYHQSDLIKLEVAINDEVIPLFSQIVSSANKDYQAKYLVNKLAEVIPKQLIEIKIQARIGAKSIYSRKISPLKKDVIAKLYGGDVTRKRKLQDKQKKGKERMKQFGRVNLPSDIFIKLIK